MVSQGPGGLVGSDRGFAKMSLLAEKRMARRILKAQAEAEAEAEAESGWALSPASRVQQSKLSNQSKLSKPVQIVGKPPVESPARTLYDIVGVGHQADPAGLKQAYYSRAREYTQGNVSKMAEFRALQRAYDELSDPEK
eukprot:COSAG01_NODE_27264_length_690_cov_0.957699_1_plen_138_part_01